MERKKASTDEAKRSLLKEKNASVKFTVDQYQMIEDRAHQCGVPTGVWMRFVLVQAAKSRRSSDGGYLRIREPDGNTT